MASLAEHSSLPRPPERYVLGDELGSGGMASVHMGRLLGPGGFSRTVAIKRLHASYAKDPDFCSMFLDEARVTSRVSHPNVVSTLDVVHQRGELFLVMDYVPGDTLSHLWSAVRARGARVPPRIAAAIVVGALHGLQAAHEARSESGEPLGIVHRDVSPQNIMVGVDGIPRVVDFGIARAEGRSHQTRDGIIKGKAPYMAPEQLRGQPLDHRVDLYAAGVALWETLVGERLFAGESMADTMTRVLEQPVDPPSRHVPELSPEVDAVILKAIARKAEQRFASAREMAAALEAVLPPAPALELGAWVTTTGGSILHSRAARVTDMERQRYETGRASALMERQPTVIAAEDLVRATARARRTRLLLAGASVAVLVVSFLGVRSVVGASPAAIEARNSVTAGEESARDGVDAAGPAVPAIATDPAPAVAAVTATPSITAPPAPVAVKRGRRPPPRSSPTPPDCSPPYTLTADGLRIPKPACATAP